jgi:tRNA-guanine family transglycosylase
MRFVPSFWDRARPRRHILQRILEETGDALLSYAHVRGIDPRGLRERLSIPNTVNLWIDSSGFQIGNMVAGRSNIFDVYDFQNSCSQVAISLDTPGDVQETYRNAILTLAYSKGFPISPKIYAVATSDGSFEHLHDLVRKYDALDFDGVAVGALIPYGSLRLERLGLLLTTVARATSKPIHALGIGGYDALYVLAAAGVATFDSSKFLVGAKWRIYHLPRGGMIYVGDHYEKKNRRSRQTRTGDLPCRCPACLIAKRIEFFQEPKAESVAILALHNYYMMKNEVQLIKLAMDEGWFHHLFLDRAKKSASLKRSMGPLGLSKSHKEPRNFA